MQQEGSGQPGEDIYIHGRDREAVTAGGQDSDGGESGCHGQDPLLLPEKARGEVYIGLNISTAEDKILLDQIKYIEERVSTM